MSKIRSRVLSATVWRRKLSNMREESLDVAALSAGLKQPLKPMIQISLETLMAEADVPSVRLLRWQQRPKSRRKIPLVAVVAAVVLSVKLRRKQPCQKEKRRNLAVIAARRVMHQLPSPRERLFLT